MDDLQLPQAKSGQKSGPPYWFEISEMYPQLSTLTQYIIQQVVPTKQSDWSKRHLEGV